MAIPSFEEVLTFVFNTVKNRQSIKTSEGVLCNAFLRDYDLKEISYCSLWDRYILAMSEQDLVTISKEKLGKPLKDGQDFYNDLISFACDILRMNGITKGHYNNGLKNYSFLGSNFNGKITLKILKSRDNYLDFIKLLAIKMISEGYQNSLSANFSYDVDKAVSDITYTIQSFNKRIYDNQDPFLIQLEKDLLETTSVFFKNNWTMNELTNWSMRIENLNSQIQSLNEELNQLKTLPKQDLILSEAPNLNEQLLFKLKKMHPTTFEKFSLELIGSIAVSRGGEVEIFHNGQVGDGGVDGVIEAQKTFGRGKERVFVQCKRYDKTSIGRPELQAFAGAMLTEDITVGIFLTTSSFSKQAVNYVEELDKRGKSIELFDGERIVKYMLKNKIGIDEKIVSKFEINDKYFDKFN